LRAKIEFDVATLKAQYSNMYKNVFILGKKIVNSNIHSVQFLSLGFGKEHVQKFPSSASILAMF